MRDLTAETIEYAGFWIRFWASMVDTILLVLLTTVIYLLLYALFGGPGLVYAVSFQMNGFVNVLLTWVLPAVAVIWFWTAKEATPGKMLLSLKIVDANTGNSLKMGQSLLRYVGYFVSTIPFFLGLIWVGFDSKKQGWHDKIAGTVVVRSKQRGTEAVRFPQA